MRLSLSCRKWPLEPRKQTPVSSLINVSAPELFVYTAASGQIAVGRWKQLLYGGKITLKIRPGSGEPAAWSL